MPKMQSINSSIHNSIAFFFFSSSIHFSKTFILLNHLFRILENHRYKWTRSLFIVFSSAHTLHTGFAFICFLFVYFFFFLSSAFCTIYAYVNKNFIEFFFFSLSLSVFNGYLNIISKNELILMMMQRKKCKRSAIICSWNYFKSSSIQLFSKTNSFKCCKSYELHSIPNV